MSPVNQQKVQPPAREEWDFDTNHSGKDSGYAGCPNHELKYCFEYEFSRAVFFAAAPDGAGKKVWQWDSQEAALNKFHDLFSSDFPNIPWLQISSKKRTDRLRVLSNYDFNQTFKPFQRISVSSLQDADGYQDECVRVGTFGEVHMLYACPIAVDLTSSNEEIEYEFKNWLTSVRKSSRLPAPRSGKTVNSALRTGLRALGALRLHQTLLTARAALDHIKSVLGGGTPISTIQSYSRAERQAREIIELWTLPDLAGQLVKLKSLPGMTELPAYLMSVLACRDKAALRQLIPQSLGLLKTKAELELFVAKKGTSARKTVERKPRSSC